MATTALKQQLDGLVISMRREGLLDDQFLQLQMLQDASNPGFVAEVITLFCEDSERILAELKRLLDQTLVDYQKVDAYVHQLKGSSSSNQVIIGSRVKEEKTVDSFDRSHIDNQNRKTQIFITEIDTHLAIQLVEASRDTPTNQRADVTNQSTDEHDRINMTDDPVSASVSVGAQNVKMGCIRFRQFCEGNDKEGCQTVLQGIQHDYYYLREKFQMMVQIKHFDGSRLDHFSFNLLQAGAENPSI